MSDTTSNNMEKAIRNVKEVLADIETNNRELMVVLRTQTQLHKELDRSHKLAIKDASKRKSKSKDSGEKREASGFNAKQPVPVEFCKQPWGCEADQELPRTMLTKMVYDYVKEEQLQDPTDKRRIFPNEVLKELFHLKDGDELHFNNFQTYMKRLYDRNFDVEDTDASSIGSASESEASDVEIIETKKKSTKGKGTIAAATIPETPIKSKAKKNGKKTSSTAANL